MISRDKNVNFKCLPTVCPSLNLFLRAVPTCIYTKVILIKLGGLQVKAFTTNLTQTFVLLDPISLRHSMLPRRDDATISKKECGSV
jgi:hypothetical protein